MAHITNYLQNESGIQNNGVKVINDNAPKAPINNVFIGKFKRGRLDTPMKVTKANVRAVLGHEPWNPDYVAVHDALENGIGEISVLRIYTEPFFSDDPPPSNDIVISAIYDPFYQTITVTGPQGLLAVTKDPNNNIIGSGVIPEIGSVTYFIDEGMLDGETLLKTSVENSNIVEHPLQSSLVVATYASDYKPSFYLDQIELYRDGSSYSNPLPANLEGRMIVEWEDGEKQEINLTSVAGTYLNVYSKISEKKPANTLFKAKVRIEANVPLFVGCEQTEQCFKFMSGEGKDISYRFLKSWNNEIPLTRIPSYLPPNLTRLDYMFKGYGYRDALWDDNVATTVAAWDTSHITSMIGTFYFTKQPNLNLSNWDVSNVVYMASLFGSIQIGSGRMYGTSNWNVKNVQNMDWMYYASEFGDETGEDLSKWCVSNITQPPQDFSTYSKIKNEQLPIWGTCPAK